MFKKLTTIRNPSKVNTITDDSKQVLYIDMQCFDTPTCTPKEISFTYDGNVIDNYLILPKQKLGTLPTKLQQTISWVERNHHGIPYNSGYIKYSALTDIFLKHKAVIVFVKGAKKLNFLKKYYQNIVNVEYIVNCPKFEKHFNFDCNHHYKHMKNVMCSKHNVLTLYNYIQDNKHIFLL